MLLNKPRYAHSNWTPPPFNTIESGYIFTLPDGQFSVSMLPDKRHVARIGANSTSPSVPNYISIYDTHNYSNTANRIPVEVATRTIRAAMHPQRSKFTVYKNYYACCSDTTLDQTTMEFEVGYYDSVGNNFVFSVKTLAQFWTPAKPSAWPAANAGEFQSYIPYIFECGGKVFCAVRYVYTFTYLSMNPKPSYSVFRIFDITNGTATYVQDLQYSVGEYPNTKFVSGSNESFMNQYFLQCHGNTLVMSTYFSGVFAGAPDYTRNYIQTYTYNGTTFVPQYGNYNSLSPNTFVLVPNVNGNIVSLHKGSLNGATNVNSILSYSHGASSGSVVNTAAYSNQNVYDIDKASGFIYMPKSDYSAIDICRMNSDYSLSVVSSVTTSEIDALDPLWGVGGYVTSNGSYMVHDGAMLIRGLGLLSGRVKHALLVGGE